MSNYLEITHCALCGQSVSQATVIMELNSKQKLLRCAACGLVFNDSCRMDFETIYGQDYFQTSQKSLPGGYFAYDGMEKAVRKTYRFASAVIEAQCRNQAGDVSLLELGCGYGFFLKQFVNISNIKLTGVEMSPRAAEVARTFISDIHCEPAESVHLSRTFDFVAVFELIEHLADPASLMDRIYDLLKDGGRLFVTTPDAGAIWFRLLRKRWPGLHPAHHNVYFSRRTICRMAREWGFEVERIRSRQYFYANVRHIRLRVAELFPFLRPVMNTLRPFDALTVPFLNGGDLQVILRKSGCSRRNDTSTKHAKRVKPTDARQ